MILGKHAIGAVSLGDTEWLAGALSSDGVQFTITADGTTLEIIPNLKLYWIHPVFVVPGYSSDGTSITIPIASLPGLSVAEADATTGDWREILQAFMTFAYNDNRVFVDTPLADQYKSYKVFKKDLYGRTINSYFTVKFLTDMGEPNVAPEP